MEKYYFNFEGFLKLDNFFDLDGIDLFSDLEKSHKRFYQKTKRQWQIYLILLWNWIIPNASIAYRILLTIYTCHSHIHWKKFFKVKIIKNLLAIKERLNGLAILFIE